MNRTVMINGATGGIGSAIAKRLLDGGYNVSVGTRSEIKDPVILKAIDDKKAIRVEFDAINESSAENWAKATAETFGGVDVLINCVGTLSNYTIMDDTSDLDQVMDINVKGPIRCIKQAFPFLKQGSNPKIINFISLAGLQVVSKSAGYATSKHALRAISQAARYEGWDDGVRVTAIFPGWVNTDMIKGYAPIDEEDMTQPEDLSSLVTCLIELPKTCSVAEVVVNCQLDRL